MPTNRNEHHDADVATAMEHDDEECPCAACDYFYLLLETS